MIKFNCIIHKRTGTVIKYEDWKNNVKENGTINITQVNYSPKGNKEYHYNSKEMLFSDDFEIIYNSEFTIEELKIIFNGHQKDKDELMEKIHKNVYDKEYLKLKYGIEV